MLFTATRPFASPAYGGRYRDRVLPHWTDHHLRFDSARRSRILTFFRRVAAAARHRHRSKVNSLFKPISRPQLRSGLSLVKQIVAGTFLIEAIRPLLWVCAADRDWFASVFHAVSAFAMPGSDCTGHFMGFRDNLGVTLTVCWLMVLGGWALRGTHPRRVPRPRSRLACTPGAGHHHALLSAALCAMFLKAEMSGFQRCGWFFWCHSSIDHRERLASVSWTCALTNATLFLLIS
jgi:hypothetical protein